MAFITYSHMKCFCVQHISIISFVCWNMHNQMDIMSFLLSDQHLHGMGRQLLQCTTSSNIVTFKHQGGHWDGRGQRRR
jgi:hypothetical protein